MSTTSEERRRIERPDSMIEDYMTITYNIMRRYSPQLFTPQIVKSAAPLVEDDFEVENLIAQPQGCSV